MTWTFKFRLVYKTFTITSCPSLCIPICVHVYLGGYALGFLCMGQGQKSMLSVFLNHVSSLFLRQGLPLTLELTSWLD